MSNPVSLSQRPALRHLPLLRRGRRAASYLVERFGWPMLVRVDVIWLAVGISCAVGVLFGLWPAWKASRFDPITALRFE